MGLCAYACACACAHGHGQRALWRRERAQDRRTDSRTAGDRTAGDSDGQGQQNGRTKETSTVIVMQ